MKKTLVILFTIYIASVLPSYAEDEYWGNIEHGSSTEIGRFEYFNDGTSSTSIGRHKYFSDGTSETTVGEHTFRSDGESSTKIGDHTYRSDGNNGMDIGDWQYSKEKTIRKSDGFKWTND